MQNYLKKQETLKLQATEILQKLGLINFLSKFGKVEIVGSYYLDLMSWQDIDLVLVQEPSYKDFLEVANYLFNTEEVYSLNLQDFRKSVHPNRPQGLYLGISYLYIRELKFDGMWKIDIWFLPEKQLNAIDQRDQVKSGLTTENREIILKIKNEMREKTAHGKEVSGGDVYKAVLENGISDLEEFRKHLKNQGRDL